jgi:hypothetical protein
MWPRNGPAGRLNVVSTIRTESGFPNCRLVHWSQRNRQARSGVADWSASGRSNWMATRVSAKNTRRTLSLASHTRTRSLGDWQGMTALSGNRSAPSEKPKNVPALRAEFACAAAGRVTAKRIATAVKMDRFARTVPPGCRLTNRASAAGTCARRAHNTCTTTGQLTPRLLMLNSPPLQALVRRLPKPRSASAQPRQRGDGPGRTVHGSNRLRCAGR